MEFTRHMARILPKKTRKKYAILIRYSTLTTQPDVFLGTSISISIIIGFFATLIVSNWVELPPLAVFLAANLIILGSFHILLELNINTKSAKVEEVLPDALQLMSSNIRAGLTTDRAFARAARPEFGPLEDEIKRVFRETLAGRDLVDALSRMTLHIRSQDLTRTIELIVNSLKSGGELADLLEQTSNDIRDQQLIKKEIKASVLMYALFIFIAITLGAPLLFSMSSFLVRLLTANIKLISDQMPKDFDGMAGAPIKMEAGDIDATFIMQYSIASIVSSVFFGSMVLGLILTGEEKNGFRYLPIMLIVSVSLYFLISAGLEYVIGDMMPI